MKNKIINENKKSKKEEFGEKKQKKFNFNEENKILIQKKMNLIQKRSFKGENQIACILERNSVLIYGDGNNIKMWNIQDNKEIGVLGKHDKSVISLCLSKDGNTLYSGSWDKTIKMWNIKKLDY